MSYTLIVAILIGLAILKFAGKIMNKILGILLVVIAVFVIFYLNDLPPFQKNRASIAFLEEKYCTTDVDICDCVVNTLKTDFAQRFSSVEREEINQDKLKSAYTLKKLLKSNKSAIEECLAKRQKEDKFKQFLKDLLPIQNKYLDQVESKFKTLETSLKDKVNNVKVEKKDIDSRF